VIAGSLTTPLLGTILVQAGQPAAVATRLQALAQRYPGLHVSDSASLVSATDADRELNHWLGPFFVAMIFAFTSIAVVNTLMMIALRRRGELALLRLTGATSDWRSRPPRCCRSATRSREASVRTRPPAGSRRSSASRRSWRWWPCQYQRGGRYARSRSRRSGSESK
jgi:hypothetical protein